MGLLQVEVKITSPEWRGRLLEQFTAQVSG